MSKVAFWIDSLPNNCLWVISTWCVLNYNWFLMVMLKPPLNLQGVVGYSLWVSLSLFSGGSNYMEFYGPVQVSHSVNKILRSQDNPDFTRTLGQRLLQSSQNCHVCHRKKHIIVHLLYCGIMWRVFIPFTRILIHSEYPMLPPSWANDWQLCYLRPWGLHSQKSIPLP